VMARSLVELRFVWRGFDALSFNKPRRWLEWQPIRAWHDNGRRRVVEARLRNGHYIRATPDHVVFAYPGQKKRHKRVVEASLASLTLGDRWNHRGDVLVARELPDARRDAPLDLDTLYVLGAFVAEGSWQTRSTICISQNSHNRLVRRTIRWARSNDVHFRHHRWGVSVGLWRRPDLAKLFHECGALATGKRFPPASLAGSRRQLEELLTGYLDGDGYRPRRRMDKRGYRLSRLYSATTISMTLASQLAFVGLRLGRPMHRTQKRPKNRRHPQFTLQYNPRSVFVQELFSRAEQRDFTRRKEIGRIGKVSVRSMVPAGRARVFDITVADNHSYVLAESGLIAHNCGCADGVVLADHFDPKLGPLCIDRGNGTTPSVPVEPFFFCPKCKTMLHDPQDGLFIAHRPDVRDAIGWTWGQWLSPKITAGEMLHDWDTATDVSNYFKRKVGKPHSDPNTRPVNEEHCRAAQRPDLLAWGPPSTREVDGTFMGIDQMGGLQHIVIKARWNGQMRVVWVEVVEAEDPWERAAVLMRQFKIRYCGLEQLPNIDSARMFANTFPGRVFLVDSYGQVENELIVWGDRPRDKVTVRETADEARTKYTAKVDQYKMMAWSLGRWAHGDVVTPDARRLTQSMRTREGVKEVAVCQEVLWLHLQRVALVIEKVEGKEDERKQRRAVKKIGIDPHMAFANMLCDVAWVRAFGTERFVGLEEPGADMGQQDDKKPPSGVAQQIAQRLEDVGMGMAGPMVLMEDDAARQEEATCAICANLTERAGRTYCNAKRLYVAPTSPICPTQFVPKPEEEEPYE